jgi:hypothetical protein
MKTIINQTGKVQGTTVTSSDSLLISFPVYKEIDSIPWPQTTGKKKRHGQNNGVTVLHCGGRQYVYFAKVFYCFGYVASNNRMITCE